MSSPPNDIRGLLEHGLAAHQAGRLADAEAAFRKVLEQEQDNADALHLLGILSARRGDAPAAVELIRRAIAIRPAMPMFHNNLGNALVQAKDFPAALAAYRRAVDLAPGYAEAHANLAATLAELKDYTGAEAASRQALTLAPRHLGACKTLGTLLADRGQLDEAERYFGAVLESQPDDAYARFTLGRVLRLKGQLDEAEASFRRVLASQPGYGAAHAELGGVLLELGKFDEASVELQRALAYTADDTAALLTLAQTNWMMADFAEAARLQDRAIALQPGETLAWRHRLLTTVYDPALDAAERAAVHQAFGRAMEARVVKPLEASPDPAPERRLRVGWLSSDFRYGHPVSRNLEPLFAHRDRARFEFICYTEKTPAAEALTWSTDSADGWRLIARMSDEAVAEQIRADRVDIMVYLGGRFDRNRPQVAAWRPAPVQISLYDAATSGLAAMDYFIADPVMVPRSTAEWFSERILRVPSFYIHEPLAGAADPGPAPIQAAGHVSFGSFNSPAKLNRSVLALWGQVLRRVPNARLRLKHRTAFASPRLQHRVRDALGPDVADRVDFDAGLHTIGDHIRAYQSIDIGLDPFPYTGATTTFEALWMGVPVVTLLGDTFMGRWSASMLHALKLDEFVARTPEAYADLAVALAADPARVSRLRATLRERLSRSPLCDGRLRARQIERLLRAVWRRWCATARR